MRADHGYGPGNLLGTVSQSSGAPTGAVIETGTNTNGRYTRFADGTQICTFETFESVTASASGNVRQAVLADWSFPQDFVGAPTVIVNVDGTDTWGASSGVTATEATPVVFASVVLTNSNRTIRMTAIGSWILTRRAMLSPGLGGASRVRRDLLTDKSFKIGHAAS